MKKPKTKIKGRVTKILWKSTPYPSTTWEKGNTYIKLRDGDL